MIESARDGVSDEISVFAIGAILLRRRWSILRWAVAGGVIALALVWTRPALYRASASFIPQGADPARSGLASLAGQLGVSVSSSSASLTPDFYLRLLTSRDVLSTIVHDSMIVPEMSGRRMAVEDLLNVGPAPANVREETAVTELSRRITSSVSKPTGVVEFSVGTKWPSVSLAVARALVDGVNGFNQRTRRDQAASERKFIEGRLSVATVELRAAEDRLQKFLQGNRQTASPDLQFTQDRMQREVTLRQQVYSSLTQSYDEVRIREARDTPVITMVDEPTVDAKPESRGRGVRTLIGVLIGAVVGALFAFISDLMMKRRAEGDPATTDFAVAADEVKGDMLRRLRRLSGRASA